MNKEEFLTEIQRRLTGLPQADIDERIDFYREMIEDRVEEGITEEEAVAEIGSVDNVIEQILPEMPLTKLVKEKVKPKRQLKAWEIILLVLGSPVWVPLIAAALIIILSLYIVLWAIVICVYAATVSVAAASLSCLAGIAIYLKAGNVSAAVFSGGAALLCAGLTILLFRLSMWVTKGIAILSKKILLGIKYSFIGKES